MSRRHLVGGGAAAHFSSTREAVVDVSIEEIARAISSHRFEDAEPYLSEDVVWELVGEDDLVGKQAVVEVCTAVAAELHDAETTFDQFRVVVGASCVVIDSVAGYRAADGSLSRVASCDIYDFTGAELTRIRSYNIELTPQQANTAN
ncbi:MAG: uncharacterized protein JWQ75_1221 [Pseudarthrobacter sp.]|nr:uncharacterized protein [Pseudarthrobacter sp.]